MRGCSVRSLVLGLAWLVLVSGAASARADEKDGRLDIYFIDVEGGAATLFVTPEGESVLIDSGYPDYGGRDKNRILDVLQKVAGRQGLDHAVVSHWHLDHYGNHAALADAIKIGHFWDRGIPETLPEDKDYAQRIALYRAAAQNKSKALAAGDAFPLKSGKTTLAVKVVTASGEVIPNEGQDNPHAAAAKPKADDTSDNAKSISLLWQFGDFRFLCCGDLTWNTEAKLVTPKNPLGQVDLYQVTHHGLDVSNNPALVLAIDPVVTVMCNGPTKGGAPEVLATLKQVKSNKAQFQLHRNIKLADADQPAKGRIANAEDTNDCRGNWIKASVAADGKSYTVQVGPRGTPETFATRASGGRP